MFMRLATAAIGALALASCHTTPPPTPGGGASIFPPPVSNYACQGGTRLAVRLMGESASVQVDGQPAMSLPQISSSSELTSYSSGTHVLNIRQGQVSWGVGRAMPVPCTGG